jgi:hypothetical protein
MEMQKVLYLSELQYRELEALTVAKKWQVQIGKVRLENATSLSRKKTPRERKDAIVAGPTIGCSNFEVLELPQEFFEIGVKYLWRQLDSTSCGACAINNLLQKKVVDHCSELLGVQEVTTILEMQSFHVKELWSEKSLIGELGNGAVLGFLMRGKSKTKGDENFYWTSLKKAESSWVHLDSVAYPPEILNASNVFEWIVKQEFETPVLVVWKRGYDDDEGPKKPPAKNVSYIVKGEVNICPKIEKITVEDIDGIGFLWRQRDATSCGACAINNLLQKEVEGPCAAPLSFGNVEGILKTNKNLQIVQLRNLQEIEEELKRNKGSIIGLLLQQIVVQKLSSEPEQLHWTTLKSMDTSWVYLDSLALRPEILRSDVLDWIMQQNQWLEWPILMVLKTGEKSGEPKPGCQPFRIVELPDDFEVKYLWQSDEDTSCGACAVNNLLQREVEEACDEPLRLEEVEKILQRERYEVTRLSTRTYVSHLTSNKDDACLIGVLMQLEPQTKSKPKPKSKLETKSDVDSRWIALKKTKTSFFYLDSLSEKPQQIGNLEGFIYHHNVQFPMLMVEKKIDKIKVKGFEDYGIRYLWHSELSCVACAINNLLQEEVAKPCSDPFDLADVMELLKEKNLNVIETSKRNKFNDLAKDDSFLGCLVRRTLDGGSPHWSAIKKLRSSWIFLDSRDTSPSKEIPAWTLDRKWKLLFLVVMRIRPQVESPPRPDENHYTEATPPMTGNWGLRETDHHTSNLPEDESGSESDALMNEFFRPIGRKEFEHAAMIDEQNRLKSQQEASMEALNVSERNEGGINAQVPPIPTGLFPPTTGIPKDEAKYPTGLLPPTTGIPTDEANYPTGLLPPTTIAPRVVQRSLEADKMILKTPKRAAMRNIAKPVKCREIDKEKKCYIKVFKENYSPTDVDKTLRVNQEFSEKDFTPKLYEGGMWENGMVLLMERYTYSLYDLFRKWFSSYPKDNLQHLNSEKIEEFGLKSHKMLELIDVVLRLIRSVAQHGWFLADVKSPNIVVDSDERRVRVIDIEIRHISEIDKDRKLVDTHGKASVIFTYNVTMLYLLSKYIQQFHDYEYYLKFNKYYSIPDIFGRIGDELKNFHFQLPSYEDVKETDLFRVLKKIYDHYHDTDGRKLPAVPFKFFWGKLRDRISYTTSKDPKYEGDESYNIEVNNNLKDLPPPLSEHTKQLAQAELQKRT